MTPNFLKTATLSRYGVSIIAIAALCTAASQTAVAVDANGRITFQDIYDNPDDQALNLEYAKQKAEDGDLVSAAGALERMLFAQPNWDSARLFYALTLYQLDDRQAAKRELNLLSSRPLTPRQREVLNRYQRDFEDDGRSQSGGRFQGRVAAGVRYDDNAGNALGDVVFGGRDIGDVSGTLQAVGRYSVPLSAEGNTRLSIRGDAQIRRHETVSDADFDTYGLQAGLDGRVGRMTWAAGADLLTVNISGDSYLDQIGGYAELSGAVSDELVWTARGEYADQDYKELPFTTNEVNRSGDKITIDGGLELTPNEKLFLALNIAYEDKTAIDDTLAYDGYRVRVRGVYGFNSDSYISGTAEYRDIEYDGDSIFLFPSRPRTDENFKARLAAGIKPNRILRSIDMKPSPLLNSVTFEVGGHYIERNTNIPGSGFDDIGGEFKVILDF